MKEYKYSFAFYFVSSLGPIILLTGLLVWGIMGRLEDSVNPIYHLVIIVVPVILLSSLVALNQPDKITDDEEIISFYGFGREHRYRWADIKFLKVKEFIFTDRILLRIGEPRVLGGRYWMNVDSLENGKQLLEKLKSYEIRLHPEEKGVKLSNRKKW